MNPEASAPQQPVSVYFAGELFSAKHLAGNAMLAVAIGRACGGRYAVVLPQNIELRDGITPREIRDADLRALMACDAAIINLDGPEPDAGTVVELLFAKFADLPAVLLRTDGRGGGDQPDGEPWNLMLSGYPRTRTVLMSALGLYHGGAALPALMQTEDDAARTFERVQQIIDRTAQELVAALDDVLSQPPLLPEADRPVVCGWIERLIGS